MRRMIDELGIDAQQADVLTRAADTAALFDTAVAAGADVPAQSVANWIVNELPRVQGDRALDELALAGTQLARLIALVERGDITSAVARTVLAELAEDGGDAVAIVDRDNLRQVGDAAALEPLVREIVARYPERVQQYRAGRQGLLGFFVGQVMSQTQGRANPQLVSELVRAQLEA
jgi:Asp-tRNA(Asn)/Glu-tRNA(Gln) amidotransferase B subunit